MPKILGIGIETARALRLKCLLGAGRPTTVVGLASAGYLAQCNSLKCGPKSVGYMALTDPVESVSALIDHLSIEAHKLPTHALTLGIGRHVWLGQPNDLGFVPVNIVTT